MGEGGGGEARARGWAARLERWLGRAAPEEREEETAARPAGEASEARESMSGHDRAPASHGSTTEKHLCARCGRLLRWALPLCWDCDAAAKRAGAVERR